VNKIELAIFDLGNVVYCCSFENAYQQWSKKSNKSVSYIKEHCHIDEYYDLHEVDKISIRDYKNHICSVLNIELAIDDFIEGWNSIFMDEIAGIRNVLEKLKEEKGADWLHARLQLLDPEAATKIDARNARRTIRALEVILTTGRKFSDQRGQIDSPYQLITIGLTRPRPELYQRVDERIDAMFANGFVDEVKGLLEKGYSPTLPSMSAIGYRECVHVVNNEWSVDQAKVEIRRATRVFVRRQANWFKESDPNIMWFHPNQKEEIESYLRNTLIGL